MRPQATRGRTTPHGFGTPRFRADTAFDRPRQARRNQPRTRGSTGTVAALVVAGLAVVGTVAALFVFRGRTDAVAAERRDTKRDAQREALPPKAAQSAATPAAKAPAAATASPKESVTPPPPPNLEKQTAPDPLPAEDPPAAEKKTAVETTPTKKKAAPPELFSFQIGPKEKYVAGPEGHAAKADEIWVVKTTFPDEVGTLRLLCARKLKNFEADDFDPERDSRWFDLDAKDINKDFRLLTAEKAERLLVLFIKYENGDKNRGSWFALLPADYEAATGKKLKP